MSRGRKRRDRLAYLAAQAAMSPGERERVESEREERQRAADAERERVARDLYEREPVLRDAVRDVLLTADARVHRGFEGGSEYWVLPSGTRVRLSDHALPQTHERDYWHGRGQRSYDIDIVLTEPLRDGSVRLRPTAAVVAETREWLEDELNAALDPVW